MCQYHVIGSLSTAAATMQIDQVSFMAETQLTHSGTAGTEDGSQTDTSPPAYNEATGILNIRQEGLNTQTQVGSVFSALVQQCDQS